MDIVTSMSILNYRLPVFIMWMLIPVRRHSCYSTEWTAISWEVTEGIGANTYFCW